MSDQKDMALLLVCLGDEDGGRVDPARILACKPGSASRQAFLDAQEHGWLDGEGWVTRCGREALSAVSGKEGKPGHEFPNPVGRNEER